MQRGEVCEKKRGGVEERRMATEGKVEQSLGKRQTP